jgi:hypothetical protein
MINTEVGDELVLKLILAEMDLLKDKMAGVSG